MNSVNSFLSGNLECLYANTLLLRPQDLLGKIDYFQMYKQFFAAVLIKNDGKVFYMEITLDIVLLSL
ncbi:hypothetical protein D1157_16770 [Anaerotruncus sp. X29]|nr:hypothetical protein [Anaerotruncus sp. 1XD42-93]NCE76615.1 hypothetical protein [Anaerotruncus sp. X29]RKJ74927.1 hypothetical protein D7Y41_34030 [Anaerotruncus sp. 1XD22-93]